jgi:acetyl-CoA acyltransferase 1
MSLNYGPQAMPSQMSESVLSCQQSADCLLPMGITSENVASRFGVDRLKQDKFAVESHRKAAAAQSKGLFKEEIYPCSVTVDGKSFVVSEDDGIRGDTTLQVLQKLKPAFKEGGTTTAGNASQVTDGAAAVLFMKRKKAQELGLPIIGIVLYFNVR